MAARLAAVGLGLVAAFAMVGAVRGQALGLEGRVIDARGTPVADLRVALHRVAGEDGAMIAEATSAADGSFSFELPGVADSAVFFAATRYRDELYVGAPFRLPGPPGAEYVIVVGGDAALAMSGGGSPGPAVSRPRAASPLPFIALLGAAAAGVLLFLHALRWLRPVADPRRELLLELASIDERFADRLTRLDRAERDAYLRRRRTLRTRLDAHTAPPLN